MHFKVLPGRHWVNALLCLLALAEYGVLAKQFNSQILPTKESTCPSQTINYITATLPQQCLRTDWNGASQGTGVRANDATKTTSNQDVHKDAQEDATVTSVVNVTISASNKAGQAEVNESDGDQDPLSDNANFLSFEEWKNQMLEKTGQSPEHVAGTKMNQRKEARGGDINNALDGYGEDGEIEIKFGGFPMADVSTEALPSATASWTGDGASSNAVPSDRPQKRSKEAGSTGKHRFNYASFDCAATIMKTNTGSKGSTSVLSENKDSYMINTCSLQNKFLIVELCNDIKIDTIVLGNFEFFSSTFRSFRVSVADRYPVKADKWEDIGTFEARNTRGIQAFLVEHMRTWGRYLRVEFLTHYGAEYYCPVSLLRVHGKTMMDDWKADVKAAQGEEDDDEETEEAGSEKVVADPVKETSRIAVAETPVQNSSKAVIAEAKSTTDYPFYDHSCPRLSLHGPLVEQTELVNSFCQSDRTFCHMAKVKKFNHASVVYADARYSDQMSKPIIRSVHDRDTKSRAKKEALTSTSTVPVSTTSIAVRNKPNNDLGSASTTEAVDIGTATKSFQQASDTTGSVKSSGDSRPTTSGRSAANAVASVAPQDSFFRSVHKRLQQLEANSTLSLQYIEEQSRILREAFTKVEKRQLSKTSSFLETLNSTVLNELRQFRLQYDQIWQSTVLELSSQREQSQREVTALSLRLSLLADEILWQRRLAILQFGLIMLCLALVVFSRNTTGVSTFDVPVLQNMISKQKFARYLNPEDTSGTPSRPSSRYGRLSMSLTHLGSPSTLGISDDESGEKAVSNNGVYQLPTPTSEMDDSDTMDSLKVSPSADFSLRRAQRVPNLSNEPEDRQDDIDDQGEEGYAQAVSVHDEDARETRPFLI